MLKRKMTSTGDDLSILGFGCMRLPSKGGRIDEKRATEQITSCIEQGVNYLDTAYPYHGGASEPFVGKLLSGGLREKVKLATKLPPWSIKLRTDMDRILDEQLERLRTDHIDYYLVHSLAARSWKKMQRLGVLEFLDRARRDGRIVNAGFSFHGDIESFKQIVDDYGWQFAQIQYNYLDVENQAGTAGLKYAADKGLGIIVMEPLRGGNLGRPFPEPIADILDRSEVKRTPAEWALRWVLDHPEVQVVLSGMNDEAHIAENLRIASDATPESLTEKELALVDRARDRWRELMPVDCTGCAYCMPCPEGVDIPMCFELYNSSTVFDDRTYSRMTYLFRVAGLAHGQSSSPDLCTRCGKCEKACPQNLPIRKLLEQSQDELEFPFTPTLAWLGSKAMMLQRWALARKDKPARR